MNDWEHKAHRLIAEMCLSSYKAANYLKNGNKRKMYVPYSIPEYAKMLVDILGMHDKIEAEERAKAIFLLLNEVPDAKKD